MTVVPQTLTVREHSLRKSFSAFFDAGLIITFVAVLFLAVTKIIPISVRDPILIACSFIGLAPVLVSAVRALIRRKITIDLLASIALIFTFIERQWLSAVFINLMLASARLFDSITELRTKRIIEKLLELRPVAAKVKRNGVIKEVPLENIRVGDEVIIESGSRIPVDGIVISGHASINQATITGESELVAKVVGDEVLSSTLNEYGSLVVRADKVGEDTTLARIIALTSEAARHKGSVERIADKFSAWYIGLTLIGSAILWLAVRDLNLVLSVLLVTCADDIAVAVPLSFTVAIARAAHRGVVVKGGDVMERMKNIDVFVADKTGTLTRGAARVHKVVIFGDVSERDVLEAAGLCSVNSRHPTSRTIIHYLEEQGITPEAPDEFNEMPGEGIIVAKGKVRLYAGKIGFLEKNGLKIGAGDKKILARIQQEGRSVTIIGRDKKAIGGVVFEDELRSTAAEAVRETKALGVRKWIMLTGDNESVAHKVTHELGIDEYFSDLTPEQKLDKIRELKSKPGVLAMAGDGVNDAAALALADVSFAMGVSAAEATVEASDVTLMYDDLRRIPEVMRLGKATMKTVRRNFWIWGITNGLGLALVFGGVLGPVGAAAYNFATDFFPIFNALLIYRMKITR